MSTQREIVIKGAREHNLKNINITLPRDKFIVITGLSGSGKSSLAFDTLYAEGQRRYVESLSAYARQFLEQMDKPDVDLIEGLSPAIAIEQKSGSHNPRSTVATVTEIYDYLRLLFARVGRPHCPVCGRPIEKLSTDQMTDMVKAKFDEGARLNILAPVVRGRKGEYRKEQDQWRRQGFVRVRIDGKVHTLDETVVLEKNKKHDIEIFIDRIVLRPRSYSRLADSIELALSVADGLVIVAEEGGEELLLSAKSGCPVCNVSLPEIEPKLFSFNSPAGACPVCHGIGFITDIDPELVLDYDAPAVQCIKPFRIKQYYYSSLFNAVLRKYGIDPKKKCSELTEKERNLVLFGDGSYVEFDLKTPYKMVHKREKFDGVLSILRSRPAFFVSVMERFRREQPCPECGGKRLRPEALAVKVSGLSIIEVTQMSIEEAYEFFSRLELSEKEWQIAKRIVKEISNRLRFLQDVGLGYITLDRRADTLSGGESQRISLATQIGASLVGVMYILDEPSIGLHQRDNLKLLNTLKRLRDLGNTVIVVEHDEDTILAADYVVDMGPGAGVHGGLVVAEGSPQDIMSERDSLTGAYLSGKKEIPVPAKRRKGLGKNLILKGCTHNNLKDIDFKIPLGKFVCVTGVSGSGKSSLVIDTLYPILKNRLMGTKEDAGLVKSVYGIENIGKVIAIDQSPIGRTPRSNPATYIGAFTPIRELFAQLPESKMRGYKPGRFSFNVQGGRCEACQGDGMIKIEMHFLPDVYVKCDVCNGLRFNRETLEITYKGKTIADVLDMTVEEALEFFYNIPAIRNKLQTIFDVGLGYIKLGQPATTLSGGEAQRVKLAKELSKRSTGDTLYILDEPTTGLHFEDVRKLLEVLNRLVDAGNTVVVIEHNLEVIKSADWIVDLGPEGGADGGFIVAEGTPEKVARVEQSYTGRFLKEKLKKGSSSGKSKKGGKK